MRTGVAISLVAHGALGAALLVSLPVATLEAPDESSPIEFIEIADITELSIGLDTVVPEPEPEPPAAAPEPVAEPEPAPEPEPPQLEPEPQPEPEPVAEPRQIEAAPEPEPAPQPETEAFPELEPEAEPEPLPQPEPEPQRADVGLLPAPPRPRPAAIAAAAPPEPDPEPEEPELEAAEPAEPELEAAEPEPELAEAPPLQPEEPVEDTPDDIAALIGAPDDDGPAAAGAPDAPANTALTQSEIDALRDAIAACWFPPAGWNNPEEVRVVLQFRLSRDGNVVGVPNVVSAPAGQYAAVATQRAISAVRSCAPYDLPPEKYSEWQEIQINFDPFDMFQP